MNRYAPFIFVAVMVLAEHSFGDDPNCAPAGTSLDRHLQIADDELSYPTAFVAQINQPNAMVPAATIVGNELEFVGKADTHARCVVHDPTATAAQRAHAQAVLADVEPLRALLNKELHRTTAYQQAVAAHNALNQTRAAATIEDAQAQAKLAQAAATAAMAERDASMGDGVVAGYYDDANDAASAALGDVATRQAAPSSICGADDHTKMRRWCGTYGLFAASLSYIAVKTADGWTAQNHLVAVAVPSAALRVIPSSSVGWLAIDFGLYSAFLTQSLTYAAASNTKTPCASTATEFEKRLPCEANAPVFPYVAAYVGATVGKSGVGFLTIALPAFGIAQVGSDTTLRPFIGLTIGILQLNGKF